MNKKNQSERKYILPWPELMRIGLGQLKLAPDQFWSSTPKEFRATLEGATGQTPEQTMPRYILNDLMLNHPDIKKPAQSPTKTSLA